MYKLYVVKNAEKNPECHEIFRKILVLPLLSAQKVQEGVTVIRNSINEKFSNIPKIKKTWLKFIDLYFTPEWMRKITPYIFSVYMLTDRTNNYIESYHRSLNATLRTNPNSNMFVGKQLIMAMNYAITIIFRFCLILRDPVQTSII